MDKPSVLQLGLQLQQVRVRRGWSLSQLAAAAGIAKSNVSRLEQGVGNPTLDTIWRLALALEVPFGDLMVPSVHMVDAEGGQVRLLGQGHDDPAVDAYWFCCAPNTHRVATPHAAGTLERITMISGELIVGPLASPKRLKAGDSYAFAADTAHCYQTEQGGATAVLTIVYPRRVDPQPTYGADDGQ